MNVLFVGADKDNATDGVIVRGIYNIFSEAFPGHLATYIQIENDIDMDNFMPTVKFDMVVVCGTPWLWDSFQLTPKYRNLVRCFEAHPEAKRVFMGIGSCLNIKDMNSNILERPAEQEAMRGLYSEALVFVRESLAYNKLEKAGVKSHLIRCPAFFCYDDNIHTLEENTVLIWTDPLKTISSGDWKDPDKLNAYNQRVLDFYKRYNCDVYCHLPEEIPAAEALGLGTPELLFSWPDTLDVMRKAKRVLSGRVHCAIPAATLGKKVELLVLDSRHLTLSEFIGTPNEPDFKFYIERLREYATSW